MATYEVNRAVGRLLKRIWSLSGCTQRHRTLVSTTRDIPVTTGSAVFGQRRVVEKRWQEFFSDPSHWWDGRSEKVNARYPDFKHKKTKESLWVNDQFNPPWVEAKLAAMLPGTVQVDVFTWNRKLGRLAKVGSYERTLEIFRKMQKEGVEPDKFTFVPVLNACSNLQALGQGRLIHAQIIKNGFESDVFVASCLVDMYAKCGSIEDAWEVFNKMTKRDVVSWNNMILGYAKFGQGEKALELYKEMKRENVVPDRVSFVGALGACASFASLGEGRLIHEQIIQANRESDIVLGNSIIDMYTKCGSLEDAIKMFKKMPVRDVITWTSMILGHVKCGKAAAALQLFQVMESEGVEPDPMTFVAVLNACASVNSLYEGKFIHEQIIRKKMESDLFVGNSLVDMYAKCGSIEDARAVFDNIPKKDAVSFTSMIVGYARCGQGDKALELFRQMPIEGVRPDSVTFVGALNACASITSLDEGRYVHRQIVRRRCESDVTVGSSLVDMYAKCGSIEDAWKVFKNMPIRNVVSWNAMLTGYALHVDTKGALAHFDQMCKGGVELDGVTFVSLLSACSHGGLIDEGFLYFESMSVLHNIPATLEHYVCMIDLLCRSGRLHEAKDLIHGMPFDPTVPVWKCLLSACRVHGNLELGEIVGSNVLALDSGNSGGYVLLSNMYAAASKWINSEIVQAMRKDNGVKKDPGCTWIELNSKVHSFTADGRKHPQIKEIHIVLGKLMEQIKEAGYVPDTSFVLHDVDDGEKEFHLCHHSEKLAIAFGVMRTDPGTPLRLFKNLRVCGDCHTATKFIAKVTGRVIIVRDANRFHHFEDGLCSCKDYW